MCKHSSKQTVHLEDYHVMFFLLNKRKRALLPFNGCFDLSVVFQKQFERDAWNKKMKLLHILRNFYEYMIDYSVLSDWNLSRFLRSVILRIILQNLGHIFTYAFLSDISLQIHIGLRFFQIFALRLYLLRLMNTFVI